LRAEGILKNRVWYFSAALSLGVSVCACGGGTSDDVPATTAGSAGTHSASGASTGGAGGGGGTNGGTTSGGATTGGTNGVVRSCTGQFGTPKLAFTEGESFAVNGVSVTSDELEVYYSQGSRVAPNAEQVVRRTRTSVDAAFGAVEPLPALANVCDVDKRVNPDIADDGLTLYVTCTVVVPTGQDEGFSPLRVAHRPDRKSPFTLEAQPAGSVFSSASLSADELTAYTDGQIYNTPPQMFTRASKTAQFGPNAAVPGITTGFNSPDIASDGLTIFGSARPDVGTLQLVRATRTSQTAAFETPLPLELELKGTFGAPNITPDCALYFVYIADGSRNSDVYVAQPK
jgi:hypothetical protein